MLFLGCYLNAQGTKRVNLFCQVGLTKLHCLDIEYCKRLKNKIKQTDVSEVHVSDTKVAGLCYVVQIICCYKHDLYHME